MEVFAVEPILHLYLRSVQKTGRCVEQHDNGKPNKFIEANGALSRVSSQHFDLPYYEYTIELDKA